MAKKLTDSSKQVIVNGIALKPIEVEVLRLASNGFKAEEISKLVNYSKSHIDKMFGVSDESRSIPLKIGAKNKMQAINWCGKYFDDQ